MLLIKNISFNFTMKILTFLFSFITIMYVTRIFSPSYFGVMSFSSSIGGYFIILSSLGMPIFAMRTCCQNRRNKEKLSRVFNELFSIVLLLSIISFILMIIITLIIPKLHNNMFIIMLYGSGIFFQLIGCDWLYKGLEKFKFITILIFLFRTISLLLIFLFVHSDKDFIIYILLSLLGVYGPNIICFVCLNKYVNISFKFTINRKYFKPLITFFLMSCAVSIYNDLDIVILGFMKNDYVIGLYSLVCKIKSILAITGSIIWTSILPQASELWKDKNISKFESLTKKTLYLVFVIQFFITIFCFIFAREIILIIGGSSYFESINSFRILLLTLLPIGFSNILGGQVLIPAGYEKYLLKAEIFGAIFNLLSNIIAIPFFSIEGAAITTVISEVIVWVVCIYYIKKKIKLDFSFIILKKFLYFVKKIIRNIKINIDNTFFKNSCNYYCPCCRTNLKRFYDGGFIKNNKYYNKKRYINISQEVICPVCFSLPRHRIIVSWVENNIEKFKNKKVLHFAQENSIKLCLDRNNIKYVSADLTGKVDLILDIEDTKLESNSVDIIICNHVLEHVSDYDKALKELKRIIKKDGFIILSFPIDMNINDVYEDNSITSEMGRIKHFGQFDHRRVFGKNSEKLLKNYGFRVNKIPINNLNENIKPVVGPANYDSNIIFILKRQ